MNALRAGSLDVHDVEVPAFHGLLGARLFLPPVARAAVIVALPGSCGRLSKSERLGATSLARAGFATLLIDLLTEDEVSEDASEDPRSLGRFALANLPLRSGSLVQRSAEPAPLRTDVPLLADRLLTAARWLGKHPVTARLQLGYLGVGDAATAALFVTALEPGRAFAVVSRATCASLAATSLQLTHVPTLFIATGGDARSHQAHREACGHSAWRKVEVVASAEGELDAGPSRDRVDGLSADWFKRWLAPRPRPTWTRRAHAD